MEADVPCVTKLEALSVAICVALKRLMLQSQRRTHFLKKSGRQMKSELRDDAGSILV